NKPVCGESLSADLEVIEPFCEKLNELIQSAKFEKFQLYNADEIGQPGRKLNKQRVSGLFCANADGSHRLKPAMVGMSRQPRLLKDGFENDDFCECLRLAGEHQVCSNDISEWLEADDGDPGYQILSEAEIAASVQNQGDDEDNDDVETSNFKGEKLFDMHDWIDRIIGHIDYSNDPAFHLHYEHLRTLRVDYKRAKSKIQ
ncbi:Tigger transposable element-derived protein 7-like 64, partial [Homarus americanus]